jgi:riboflavin biosynthesis pyrimidine reductase
VGPEAEEAARKRLAETGASVVPVAVGPLGLDLDTVLAHAGREGRQDLWLEAGARTLRRFLSEDRLAQLVLYLGSRWVGAGLTAFLEETHDPLGPFSQVTWVPLGRDVAGVFHKSPRPFGPAPLSQ